MNFKHNFDLEPMWCSLVSGVCKRSKEKKVRDKRKINKNRLG